MAAVANKCLSDLSDVVWKFGYTFLKLGASGGGKETVVV